MTGNTVRRVRIAVFNGLPVKGVTIGAGYFNSVPFHYFRVFMAGTAQFDHSVGRPALLQAMGEVTVKVDYKGRIYTGVAAGTDVIEASAKAYLNCLNRIL